MLNVGFIALIVLFIVITIGFFKKMNVGLLAIAAAVLLGYISGEFKAKDIVGGFSSSLMMTLLGVTFLFSVIQTTGALEHLVQKIVRKTGSFTWFVPIVMYIVGFVVSAVGPGCVPALAVVAAIAIPLAKETGYNPIMLMLIGDSATYAGRFTAITPEGILITKIMKEQNISGVLTPMIINATGVTIILSIIFYIFYKGYKVNKAHNISKEAVAPFKSSEYIALLGIIAMVACVVFLKMDVGLTSFLIAMILILLGVAQEKTSFAGIPWNTIILVVGVGVLMNLVIASGGIKILADWLSTIMTPKTAAGITGLTAGIMSWFSSTLGVVLPTLLPTVGLIVENVGGNVSAVEIVTAIGVTASFAGFSPASTVGALIMASCAADPDYKKIDQSKLFVELFAWSIFCVIFISIIALTGVFGIVG
ncbi:MAG: SLC13 family permease [Filifactoraceae bacterium]